MQRPAGVRACVYVRARASTCVRACTCGACARACVRACVPTCVRACVRVCVRVRACARVCARVPMHTAARGAPHVEERRAPLRDHPRLMLAMPRAEASEGARGLRRVGVASGGEVAFALPPLEGMPPTVAEVADVRTPLGRRDHLVATAQRQPVHVAVHLPCK